MGRKKADMRNRIIPLLFLLLFAFSTFSQNSPAIWTELGFSKGIVKNLKLEFNPELRLLGDYKMDSYILEGGLGYKVHKYFSVAGYYRFEQAWDYKKSGVYKGQASYNRMAFDAKTGYELLRFNLQARIRYTKGLDASNNASELRYRAKIDYDIKGLKFVPFVSIELFNDRSVTDLDKTYISGGFKGINKVRYTAGLAYDFNKNNSVGLFYRLQNNRVKNEWNNILGLSYSHDF
jgi:hypothetical protein